MNDRFYGLFDPITQSIEHISPCANCQSTQTSCVYDLPKKSQLPGLINKEVKQLYRRAYFVRCDECDSVGLATKKQWQAVIEWNKSPKSIKQPLAQFPLFGIAQLNKAQAKVRLNEIRLDLEQRKKTRVDRGDRLYNNNYEKIRAFLAWSIYAQTVVKLSNTESTK